MEKRRITWTHPSVLALAAGADPVLVISEKARGVALRAMEAGWSGPPFDPFQLAEHLGVEVVPRSDILDARTVPAPAGRVALEYDPNRPASRVRYSVCHELAHTLFPDCREMVRNRATHERMSADEWQLEMLCNIAAAELLMPIGSLSDIPEGDLSIDSAIELRKRFEVSTEAMVLRLVKLTEECCFVFCASPHGSERANPKYCIDYSVSSKRWRANVPTGTSLPRGSLVGECTAVGFTAKGEEDWGLALKKLRIECLGIPPYPGHQLPRVLGIAWPDKPSSTGATSITYLVGDATEPRGRGSRLIVHIVNDKALSWGAGFGLAARKRWPAVQEQFTEWARANRRHLSLGNVRVSQIEPELNIAHMVCQHGYGPSPRPRIRYGALQQCLEQTAQIAKTESATVHMPRIGSGEAGGSWYIVRDLVNETLCKAGLNVFVYDLPYGRKPAISRQEAIPFDPRSERPRVQ